MSNPRLYRVDPVLDGIGLLGNPLLFEIMLRIKWQRMARATNFNAGVTTKTNPAVVVTFSATPTFDLGVSSYLQFTLTGDVTSSSIITTGITLNGGEILILELIQDGSGGHLFNWPTNILGAATYPLSTTANDRTLVTLLYNGANWMFQCPPTISQ